MISILLPSRGRPDNIVRLANSIFETASDPSEIEIIVRLDEDDPMLEEYMDNPPKQTTYFTRDYKFPVGSIIVDPLGLMDEQEGIELVKL